jgi:hypothetical protein
MMSNMQLRGKFQWKRQTLGNTQRKADHPDGRVGQLEVVQPVRSLELPEIPEDR